MGGTLSQLDWWVMGAVGMMHFYETPSTKEFWNQDPSRYNLWRSRAQTDGLLPLWAWGPVVFLTKCLMGISCFWFWKAAVPAPHTHFVSLPLFLTSLVVHLLANWLDKHRGPQTVQQPDDT